MDTPARTGRAAPLDRHWRHSSFSTGSEATCVDVALFGDAVLMRDSKDPQGPLLRFTAAEWQVFLLGVRAREFELPDHVSPPTAAVSNSREPSASAAARTASARASA